MSPIISILSAVRNEAQYVEEMIESVEGQDLEDWEILFVSDGSTDATDELIQSRAERDCRIKVVGRGDHVGKVSAFNLAYAHARGDLIVLLAGDDKLSPYSLSIRHRAMTSHRLHEPTVAFFKLLTFSEDARHHGMLLPRGNRASRSGGVITMNRALADQVFPIDGGLVSEDIWLATAAVEVAHHIVERTEVVLHYRIHSGNSNPRAKGFSEMNQATHRRHYAWKALLDSDRFSIDPERRAKYERLWDAELYRYAGRTLAVLRSRIPIPDRFALAAASRPTLFHLRSRMYRQLSGRRGR